MWSKRYAISGMGHAALYKKFSQLGVTTLQLSLIKSGCAEHGAASEGGTEGVEDKGDL
jgi:hypothetical protein